MRPVEFGEALGAGTRLTLFSDDKPTASSGSSSFAWTKRQASHLHSEPKVEGYFQNGKRSFLRLSTKGGKEQEFTVTVNHVLEEILDAYLQASGLLAYPTLAISHGLSL